MAIRCSHLLNVTLCFVNVINQSENNQIYRMRRAVVQIRTASSWLDARRTNIIPPPLIGGDEPPLDYFTTEESTLTESVATATESTKVESTAVESVAGAEPLPLPHAVNPTVNATTAANTTFFIVLLFIFN